MLIMRIVCKDRNEWNKVRDLLSSSVNVDIPRHDALKADLIIISNKRNIRVEQ